MTSLYDERTVTMCVIGYAGFLRFSEIVGIRGCNILFFELYVSIFIEKSKIDKYREGSYVIIAKSNTITCPVKILQDYVNCAGINLHEEKYIFRQISYCKSTDSFKLCNAGHISYTRTREILLEKLEILGLDKNNFELHSLRAGGATAADNAGVSDRLFKKHDRWKTNKAKDGYVHEVYFVSLDEFRNLNKISFFIFSLSLLVEVQHLMLASGTSNIRVCYLIDKYFMFV